MLLNCDLGEIEDSSHAIERAVMPLIDMANIACGLHAGSHHTLYNTLKIAQSSSVSVGAHPGYNDRDNFGRVSIPHSEDELISLFHYQVSAFEGLTRLCGLEMDYVKTHGALYNDMMFSKEVRQAVFKAMGQRPGSRKLVMLATADSEKLVREAAKFDIELMFESFADRSYTNKGFLSPRSEPGAVLDHKQMLEQVQQLCEDQTVTTLDGQTLPINAETLCIHGDSPDSIKVIHDIRQLVDKSGKHH